MCSQFIPDAWRKPVPSAALPADDSAGEWASFGDAQTGQLDIANDRTASTISIYEKCEAFLKAATDSLKPKPWWKFWDW
ncbi:MAG: hypothetical protein ISS15_05270 [Alphaproteobacteria bacterium]|nr:hypothetical protein [Alphaproteobacteria bacterium]MBL6939470.1 hypothetical protein [Alphaproteobacteria bacterium]MBL7097049.1 hypothetical protein [Alphaproteobacteria bacterium]